MKRGLAKAGSGSKQSAKFITSLHSGEPSNQFQDKERVRTRRVGDVHSRNGGPAREAAASKTQTQLFGKQ